MTLEINTSSLELLEPDSTIPTRVDVLQLGGVSTMFVNFDQTFASGTYNTFLIGDIIQLIIGNVKPVVVGGEGLNVTLAWRLPRTLADQAPATVHLDNLAGNKRRFAGQKSHCARDIQGLA